VPLVHPCSTEGCSTLTMGEHCLACESEQSELDEHELRRAQGASPLEAGDVATAP
jgi:hypothetical protein